MKFFSFSFLACLFLACTQSPGTSGRHAVFLKDSLVLDISDEIISVKPYDDINLGDHLLLLGQNALYEYSFPGKQVLKIPLPTVSASVLDFFAVNRDSIFYITDSSEIILANANSKPLRKWRIEGLGKNYIGVFSDFPFTVKTGRAFFYQYPDYEINNNQNVISYMRTKRETIYNLRSGRIESNEYGGYPNSLLENSRYIFNPARTMDNKGNLVYSYAHSDSVYIFNYLSKASFATTTKSGEFKENSLFDFARINNFDYISNYLTENSRFGSMVYDQYKDVYYRVLDHRAPYVNENKTINKWIDKPWSLIVLDNKLEKKAEIAFPGLRSDFTKIIPTAKGLLIGDYKAFIRDRGTVLKYEIYSF